MEKKNQENKKPILSNAWRFPASLAVTWAFMKMVSSVGLEQFPLDF